MSASADTVLVLNAGSSSLKFSLFAIDHDALDELVRGQVDGIGTDARFVAKRTDGTPPERIDLDDAACATSVAALDWLWGWLEGALAGRRLVAVGHRVVHGGPELSEPIRIDAEVMARLEALASLAPLHQPHNLAPIRRLMAERPGLPQVACFDTAFHRTQPIEAELFALPRSYYDEGVRRYGFHGLSYEYVSRRLLELAPDQARGRVVIAHLGSGVSMCALHDGRSRATTMGFTALDGCPMGTRTGNLDPGVVLYLGRERGMSFDEIETLLYKRSGLLGLSGVSNDMRELESSDAPGARLAIDYFVYRLAREVASLAGAIGGLDALVFTAGIGENSPRMRAALCERLRWLGVELDVAANTAGAARISSAGSRVSAWRVPTDEERMIAGHTRALLGLGRS
ncbi:MAG: acetate/propionate family kinase [Burkholderiaceae bacterium]